MLEFTYGGAQSPITHGMTKTINNMLLWVFYYLCICMCLWHSCSTVGYVEHTHCLRETFRYAGNDSIYSALLSWRMDIFGLMNCLVVLTKKKTSEITWALQFCFNNMYTYVYISCVCLIIIPTYPYCMHLFVIVQSLQTTDTHLSHYCYLWV